MKQYYKFMNNKVLLHAACAVIAIYAAVLCASCGKSVDVSEMIPEVRELIERSGELNEIYFGDGLPKTDDQAEIDAFYGTFAANVRSLNYTPVDGDCGYSSIDEIKAATAEVFSDDYCAYLYELAFDGISSDKAEKNVESEENEEETESAKLGEGEIIESGTADSAKYSAKSSASALEVTASYPRYLEQKGVLTVRNDLSDSAIELGREYRVDEMRFIDEKNGRIRVSIPTYVGGEFSCDVRLTIIETDDGLRLDSPTY